MRPIPRIESHSYRGGRARRRDKKAVDTRKERSHSALTTHRDGSVSDVGRGGHRIWADFADNDSNYFLSTRREVGHC